VRPAPSIVLELRNQLAALGWVLDLLVAGSVAGADYIPGVSDLDLVAIVEGPVDHRRQAVLEALHHHLDDGLGAGLHLGCAYVDDGSISQLSASHPTWTHGSMVQRTLSGIARAELVTFGFAVLGRPPATLFPAMSKDDVRAAARAELLGYWGWAARRPWLWLDPVLADLALTSMSRGRHTLETGELLSKSRAVDLADAPRWLIDQLRARRQGTAVRSPRLRTALIAGQDVRRTIAHARDRTA
jgi:hypothetical protein